MSFVLTFFFLFIFLLRGGGAPRPCIVWAVFIKRKENWADCFKAGGGGVGTAFQTQELVGASAAYI